MLGPTETVEPRMSRPGQLGEFLDIRALSTAPDSTALVVKEMNHRWFNALSVISISLHLCARRGDASDALRATLVDLHVQIQAMAKMHRRLSEPPAAGASIEPYCRALCFDVLSCFGRNDILPRLQFCDARLPEACALKLGAIVVELMTNAVKHGRPDPSGGGVVWLALRPADNGRLELAMTDNFAAPTCATPPRPRLIEALVRDLGGELEVMARPGYSTKIRLPQD